MNDWIIFGCGDMGRQVAALLYRIDPTWEPLFATEIDHDPTQINGIKVLRVHELRPGFKFTVAIQNSIARERIAIDMIKRGGQPFNIDSDHAIIYKSAEVGIGHFIGDFNIIHPDTRIGKYFHVNSFSYVGVDSVVGDFVTLTHHNAIARGVIIEHHAFLGQGATIFPGVRIGAHAKIGMGATILKDVPPYTTAVGIWK